MRRKLLTSLVVVFTAANLALFGIAKRADAGVTDVWSCGCVMGPGGGQSPMCFSILSDDCPNAFDTSNCSCPRQQ